jgi:hypothetical protein
VNPFQKAACYDAKPHESKTYCLVAKYRERKKIKIININQQIESSICGSAIETIAKIIT